ncbi:ArsA family ATPase [Spirochaeta thermophila]|uniref:arsenite-transporting ATPase n=1 Tax=Winmispira thermophila (strain ATCC 49972 / DSM 6192 / RI 19.B1) TaxID=665571 RepID=E0RR21_WINT6|nr:ArsA family ATPase [Spirochaeta thermophila]ADN01599.1 hypothetical protein STHERM_c06400 [Spirochaeta thermophila DSM 6192]
MKQGVFFLGKGGVGKTTTASAFAAGCAAWGGMDVLAVSLDPAHNLGDVLGTSLREKPSKVGEHLSAMEIDVGKWISRYLASLRKELASTYAYTSVASLDSYFSLLRYSPGTEEYALLWAIKEIVSRYQEYDLVVFDTPPTALTLRFLALPFLSEKWLEGLKGLRTAILERRQTVLRLDPEAPVRGARRPEEDQLYHRLLGLQRRLASLRELFLARSTVVLVVNPDELSLRESIRIRDELTGLRIPIAVVCHNKAREADESWERKIRNAFRTTPVVRIPFREEEALDPDRLPVRELVDRIIDHVRKEQP